MGFDGKILSMDIASVSGWACGLVHEVPRSGSHDARAKDGDTGDLFLSFGTFAQDIVKAERPGLIAFEEPIPPSFLGKNTNPRTTAILYGLPAILELVAKRYGIPIRQINISRIRKHFVPEMKLEKKLKGDAKKREISRHVIAKCRELGWAPASGDEADALAVWSCARSYLNPKYAIETVALPLEMPGVA